MKINEILREKPLKNNGCTPIYISVSRFKKNELFWFKQFKTVPRKISAYFDRDKIVKVFKDRHPTDRLNNYYLILTTDDTIFKVNY